MANLKLWPHQLKTVEFADTNNIVFDTSSAGTGKTPAWAKVIEKRLSADSSRALIVCPKTLMRSAWLQDLKLWTPDLSIAIAEAPADEREAAFLSGSDVIVMNTDGLKWLAGKGLKWIKARMGRKPIQLIDESSWLKTPGAMRTKAAFKIAPLFEYRTNLSGTPAPNTVTEMWSQVRILDDGARLGTNFTRFKRIMQDPEPRRGFTFWVDKPHSLETTYNLISDITIGHRFDDVMPHVPPMDHSVIYYDLPKKHMDAYELFKDKAYIEMQGKDVTAINAGTLSNKLLQFASGAVYHDPDNEEQGWVVIDSGRYNLVLDLVEAREHTVVFFLWHHQRDEMLRIAKSRGISYGLLDSSVTSSKVRATTVTAFQNGDLRAIFMHHKTGAHGLTLTKGTSVIYASPIYEADSKEQGDARIRRGVQDKRTESIVILGKDTRDEHAYQVFTGKKKRMDAFNELLQKV